MRSTFLLLVTCQRAPDNGQLVSTRVFWSLHSRVEMLANWRCRGSNVTPHRRRRLPLCRAAPAEWIPRGRAQASSKPTAATAARPPSPHPSRVSLDALLPGSCRVAVAVAVAAAVTPPRGGFARKRAPATLVVTTKESESYQDSTITIVPW